MTISIYLLVFVLICLFVIVPICSKLKLTKTWTIINNILMFVYFVLLIIFTISRVQIAKFVTVEFDFSGVWANKVIHLFEFFSISDMFVNIAMLVPVGIMIYRSGFGFKNNVFKATLIGLVVGVAIETMQFILPIFRSVQLGDIIFNTISAVLGVILMYIIDILRMKGGKN